MVPKFFQGIPKLLLSFLYPAFCTVKPYLLVSGHYPKQICQSEFGIICFVQGINRIINSSIIVGKFHILHFFLNSNTVSACHVFSAASHLGYIQFIQFKFILIYFLKYFAYVHVNIIRYLHGYSFLSLHQFPKFMSESPESVTVISGILLPDVPSDHPDISDLYFVFLYFPLRCSLLLYLSFQYLPPAILPLLE